MAKIYLIRHCESEGNASRRTQAQVDALVTTKGYEQNEMLRRRFEGIHLDAVYSSDSFRSVMTAELIAKERKLPVRVRISLREVTTGVWEDMSWGNIAREYPEANRVWNKEPWNTVTPGATTFAQVAANAIHSLKRIAREIGSDGAAIAVSHSCTIKATLCTILGKPMECAKEFGHGDNTSVSLLNVDCDGNITVEFMNDDSHLPMHLKRAWGGVAGADINMEVYPCRLPEQKDELLFLAAMDARERGEALDAEAYLKGAEELLHKHPDHIALSYLKGKLTGFVCINAGEHMPCTSRMIQRLYMIPELQGKGYGEQLFGYACHVLRYEGLENVVMSCEGSAEENRVAGRFVFVGMKGFPGYKSMYLYCPPCPYPIMA